MDVTFSRTRCLVNNTQIPEPRRGGASGERKRHVSSGFASARDAGHTKIRKFLVSAAHYSDGGSERLRGTPHPRSERKSLLVTRHSTQPAALERARREQPAHSGTG